MITLEYKWFCLRRWSLDEFRWWFVNSISKIPWRLSYFWDTIRGCDVVSVYFLSNRTFNNRSKRVRLLLKTFIWGVCKVPIFFNVLNFLPPNLGWTLCFNEGMSFEIFLKIVIKSIRNYRLSVSFTSFLSHMISVTKIRKWFFIFLAF
jgi:hypothetical protein